MPEKLQKLIRSVFNNRTRVTQESGENAAAEDTKPPLVSGLEKIVYAVKHWDPFPLRAYDVDDVNEINKHLLLAIISFLLCTSFALIWISVFIINARRSHEYAPTDSFTSHILSFSAVILAMSLVSFVFILCGFVGVFRENMILIRVFYISLIVLLSFKFSIALFTFSFTGAAEYLVGSAVGNKLILNYRASTDIESAMDYLQRKFRCCGLREQGFKDWSRSIYFNCSDANPSTERCGVPWSCCRNNTGISNALCGKNVQKVDRNIASRIIYTKGCIIAILEWAKKHAFLVAFLLLLEALLLTVLIFQCIHLVNELQMMTGMYRGPWWIWIGEQGPAEQPPDQCAANRDERPMSALPFHLELIWHETPTVTDQPSFVEVDRLDGSPIEAPSSARYQQRRSTVGQRFFRAVVSRASRMANRRQAVSTEEERRRSSVGAAAAADRHRGSAADAAGWLVHPSPGGSGSAASHALQPVGEETETELAKRGTPQHFPLPPIGECASVYSTYSEVRNTTEGDQTAGKEQGINNAIGNVPTKQTISAPPSDTYSAPNTEQTPRPKDQETAKSAPLVLNTSQNQINLPKIHSEQGASKQLVQLVSKFSEGNSSNRVSSARKPDEDFVRFVDPNVNHLITEVSTGSQLVDKKNDFKPPASSRIALLLETAQRHEEHEPPSPPAPSGPEARAPPGGAGRDAAVQVVHGPGVRSEAAHQPAVEAPADRAAAAVAVVLPSWAVVSSSPHPTVSTVSSVVGDDDDDDDDDDADQGAVDDGAFKANPLTSEELPSGQEDVSTAGSASHQQKRKEVSDASTDTSGNKIRKYHRRKSKPHKKKKKKGHVTPQVEPVSTGQASSATEPIHEWLRSNPTKPPDVPMSSEVTDSSYFSPSEFQDLAVRPSPKPASDVVGDHRKQRRGSLTTAISRGGLQEIMPTWSPASTSQPQRQATDDDDKYISMARVASRKLRDILPTFAFRPGGISGQEPSTSRAPARLTSPELVAVSRGVSRRPSTSRGLDAPGLVSPAVSPLSPPPEARSDADHER